MKTLKTIKAEIRKEVALTKEFFSELDRKQAECKKQAEKSKSTPEEMAELERLFNELSK